MRVVEINLIVGQMLSKLEEKIFKLSLYHRLVALLRVVEYELTDRQVTVHLGWPMSSWLDRMAIGVMIFNMMRLPRLFPNFNFIMSYTEPTGSATKVQATSVD